MITGSSLHLASKETIQNAQSINFIDCSELYKLNLIHFLLYKTLVYNKYKCIIVSESKFQNLKL